MFLKEVTKDVRLSSNQHDEEVELPPNEQHERVNSVLIASTFLLMFDVMAFLFYWSTVLSNEIIVIHKASTTEKLVTKGNICIEYYRLLAEKIMPGCFSSLQSWKQMFCCRKKISSFSMPSIMFPPYRNIYILINILK